MKKIFLFGVILLFTTIVVEAQTLDDLEKRWMPKTTSTGTISQKSCKDKWDNFMDDFVDIFSPDDNTFGYGYTYAQNFPLAVSVGGTSSYFSIDAEFGFNFDSKEYCVQNYNPECYFIVSPGIYLGVLSLNCGIGVLGSSYYDIIIGDTTYFGNETTSISGSITSEISIKTYKAHLILKPSITGFIPIFDDYYITINAGYNYLPNFKELNGWSFGIGFRRLLKIKI